ncbi:hypothetical protein [Carboxylicivirga sp. M1479]|uniref:hypothetical protein n=1 Tax=Carboxylicivirga sp. M1479 TaxID=2594476 RepID=UPI001177F004|nr:hypothetical protein [Carboxylicivirga sp. M1479]TRX71312.1 hypothetical protein FNN09_06890 [Carboxylicivirga sp. M1479]
MLGGKWFGKHVTYLKIPDMNNGAYLHYKIKASDRNFTGIVVPPNTLKMKNLLLLLCLLISVGTQAQQAKQFLLKSGYVKLELTGNSIGVKELWWDNYGQSSSELMKYTTTTKVFGIKSVEETHSLTIVKDGKFWVRDYINGTATKGEVPAYQEMYSAYESITDEEKKAMADNMIASMGGEKLGNEKVDAYLCEVYKMMGAKVWIHKGITLKSETNVMGIKMHEKYSEFVPNKSVASSKFTPASDVKYQQIGQMQQDMWSGMDMGEFGDDDTDDDSETIVPVKYSFEKFKKVMDACTIEGYNCAGTTSMDGMHASTFMKGMSAVMIIASSTQNMEGIEEVGFEAFTIDGKVCYYGSDEEEDGTALIIEYPQHEMFISIAGVPDMSKDQLVKIAQTLEF